jgi:hypothetical protein
MNIDSRPSFIPAALAEAPVDFKWKGDREHIGPVQLVTPLMERLMGVTQCGQVTQVAGLLYWAGWRLKDLAPAPAKRFLLMAPAIFAYQVDALYFDRGPVPEYEEYEEDFTPPLSAAFEIEGYARRALDAEQYWNMYYTPVRPAFHMAHLVNHIMPKKLKKDFEKWLAEMAARVKAVAAKPEEDKKGPEDFPSDEAYDSWIATHQGDPLPPQILDAAFTFDESKRKALIDAHLKSLSWEDNPYLRSPEAMLEAGFKGTPYRLT